MSLRRIAVLVEHLPDDSATIRAAAGDLAGWDLHAVLLADLFHALTGKDHPRLAEVAGRERVKEQRARLLEQRRRHMRETQQRRKG